MSQGICDICRIRPATKRVELSQQGIHRLIEVCDVDLRKLHQQSTASPFDELFSESGFNNFFANDMSELSSQMGAPLPRDRESTNIEDFISEHTKELIQNAAKIAIEFGRQEVDTEHLLYSISDSEIVKEILSQYKISADDIKGYINANSPKESTKESKDFDISVSPRVKSALETAFQVSTDMGHGYVGPEHLLIGLADEQDGMAGDILRKYGLNPESLRAKAIKVVGKGAKTGTVNPASKTPELDKYSRDLSELANQGRLDPVIGRAKEIEVTIEILARRTKNNPILIGEPGVGKTAIIEGLAQRIRNGNVPQILQNKRVVEVNINAIVAGAKFRGEFEERLKKVVDEIIANKEELIVFVDEIHTIVSSSQGGEGGIDVANVLKPPLARGELHLVGATTLNEYQKYIEKDSALERRFQPVLVPEPTIEQSIEILRGLRDKYEAHHKIKITDEAIVSSVELSDRYITNRFLPDKAIDLIDQASSRVRIGADTYTHELHDIEEQLAKLNRELEYAENHKENNLAKLKKEVSKVTQKKEATEAEWRKKRGVTSHEVLPSDIATVVSSITGIPVKELTTEEKNKLLDMEKTLEKKVIGQKEAITAVSDAVRVSRAGLGKKHQPIATMLFLGPTGVGKTELAKALAWLVFGDENDLIRIDMSEYMERHSVARLIGSPPGYIGHDEGGQLTEKVRRKPYCVILLDEIEKAHNDVYNILLQLFDDGRLTDGKGRVIDFSNTLIIATSNIGSDLIQNNIKKDGGQVKAISELKKDLMLMLKNNFKPEFINRIDEIIVFESLSKNEIKDIVKIQLQVVAQTALGQYINLKFDDSVIDYIANIGYIPEFGARELKRAIKVNIENKLAKEILSGKIKSGDNIIVKYIPKNTSIKFVNDDNQPK